MAICAVSCPRWYAIACFMSPLLLKRTATATLSYASSAVRGKKETGLASSLSVRLGSASSPYAAKVPLVRWRAGLCSIRIEERCAMLGDKSCREKLVRTRRRTVLMRRSAGSATSLGVVGTFSGTHM